MAAGIVGRKPVPADPEWNESSAFNSSRAIVPAGMGRDARPSAKNRLSPSGLYFGSSCISLRQLLVMRRAPLTIRSALWSFNVPHSYRPEFTEKARCTLFVEYRIAALDGKEEPVAASSCELRQFKQREIQTGKTAQGESSKE